jgi:hypothetical protein
VVWIVLSYEPVFASLAMVVWDKFVLIIGRQAAGWTCFFLATNTVKMFSTLRESPLPPEIPYRREIYLSQGLSAVSVRSPFVPLDILEDWPRYAGC